MPTTLGITGYNKTRYTPSHQCWTRLPNRRKKVPKAGNRVRDSPTPTGRSPQEDQAAEQQHIWGGCRSDPHRHHECWLIWNSLMSYSAKMERQENEGNMKKERNHTPRGLAYGSNWLKVKCFDTDDQICSKSVCTEITAPFGEVS